jgi:hypothetical protein
LPPPAVALATPTVSENTAHSSSTIRILGTKEPPFSLEEPEPRSPAQA